MWRTAGQQWFIKGHEDLSDDSSWHIIWHFTFCKSFCYFIYWSDLFVLVSHLRRRALVSFLKIGFIWINWSYALGNIETPLHPRWCLLTLPTNSPFRWDTISRVKFALGAFILMRDSPANQKCCCQDQAESEDEDHLKWWEHFRNFQLGCLLLGPRDWDSRFLGFARTSPTCWTSANSHWQTMWTESIYSDQWGVHHHPMKLYINPYWFQEYGSLRLIALVAHLSLPLGIWPWDLRDILSHEKFQGSLLEAKKSGEPHIYHNKLSAAMDFSKWKEWEILGIALHSALPLDQDFQRGRFSSCSRKLGQ